MCGVRGRGRAALETGGESIPYLAGWGEAGALEAVTEAAERIDAIARRIEDAVAGYLDEPRDGGEVAAAASALASDTRARRSP